MQVANIPAVITCTDVMAGQHPEIVVTFMNGMLSHGYIQNDFEVRKRAAPQFLEQATKELLKQQWQKATTAELPETTELLKASQRVG